MNRVFVTGGLGFLGRYVCHKLLDEGYTVFTTARIRNTRDFAAAELMRRKNMCVKYAVDLRDQESTCSTIKEIQPNYIINLAANVGGIGYNQENPGRLIADNLEIGISVIQAANNAIDKKQLKKFVQIGTVCSYPKYTEVPFCESNIWNGYPEETNAPYGIAKRTLMEVVKAYHKQYSFPGINLIPVNLYGPFDNFDDKSSHVIPALIKKFYNAKINNEQEVKVWGDGSASREFLYVENAARAIILAMQKHTDPTPVNLGSGTEITISDLAQKIRDIIYPNCKIVYDTTKPNGQPRRCLDIEAADVGFGFQATTTLNSGLKCTIDWYESNIINNQQASF